MPINNDNNWKFSYCDISALSKIVSSSFICLFTYMLCALLSYIQVYICYSQKYDTYDIDKTIFLYISET